MESYRRFSEDEAANLARVALERTFGEAVSLSDIKQLSDGHRRNLVLRATAATDGEPRPIIVKATRSSDYSSTSPDVVANSGLAREWIARELLKQSEGHGSSALIAGDVEHGLIVFEDFGSNLMSLDDVLLNSSATDAEAGLTAYAVSLGQLHAATIGCARRHAAIIANAFPAASIPNCAAADWLSSPLPDIDGLALPDSDVELIRSRVTDPGPWLALVHGDSCPDNVLLKDDRAWLLDFEFSTPGHMLLDGVYWRIGFPTCWCAGTVPEAVADRIDAAYRRELAAVLPDIADDRLFFEEVAIISVARMLCSLLWLLEKALVEDSTWGIATRRSRILWYLEAALCACRRADILPGSAAVMSVWLDRLKERWPESGSLASYPAFA